MTAREVLIMISGCAVGLSIGGVAYILQAPLLGAGASVALVPLFVAAWRRYR